MKIGIIGTGGIAKAYIKAINYVTDISEIHIFSTNIEKAKNTINNLDAKAQFHNTIDSLLNIVDGVIIATPNHLHCQQSLAAIEKGKPVLCEKPLSSNINEAILMTSKANDNQVKCNVGFNYRYLEIITIVKKYLDKQELGNILSVDLSYKRNSALTRKNFTWRDSGMGNLSSGALGDLGTHLFDMMSYLFNNKINLDSLLFNLKTNVKEKENKKVMVDDFAEVYGRLEKGPYFKVTTSKSSLLGEIGLKIKITGSNKSFYYNSQNNNTYFFRSSTNWTEHSFNKSYPLEDPEKEIYSWSCTFVEQLKEWILDIKNPEQENNIRLATFQNGLEAQKTLTYILDNNLSFNTAPLATN